MDLATQIRDYAAAVDDVQEPMSLDEITDVRLSSNPVRPVSLSARAPQPRPFRAWFAVATAAAAVLLVVGGVAWLFSAASSETPAATSPDGSSSSLAWFRTPYSEEVFGSGFEQSMSSVTVGGPGLVAVGGIDQRAAVWLSVDGISWTLVPHDDEVFGGDVGPSSGGGYMSDVTAGGPGLVAVGQSEPLAAVWTSPDGSNWSRVPHDDEVFGGEVGPVFGGAGMNSVTVGGPGLVAVGSDGSPDGGGDAAVWTSVDGIKWLRVPHVEAIFGGGTDGYYGQEMSSVTAGGPGLVAVGSDVGRAAVWTSPDGVTWSRVPQHGADFVGGMNSVTVGGPGLVAVGEGDNTAAVWTSFDGISWSRVSHNDSIFGAGTDTDWDVEISSVTAVVDGLVAVGSDPDGEGVAVWTSVDGLTWARAPHNEAVFQGTPDRPHLHMRTVITAGPGFVAVGERGVRPTSGATDNDAVVWVAVPQE